MKSAFTRVVVATLVILAGACGPEDETGESAGAPEGMPGMEGTQGGMMGMQGGGMMEQMRMHMEGMQGISGDSAQAMLAMHRQMVGNMLAQMNREMGEMGMETDEAWNATVDSLRSDLTRMPQMTPAEMEAFMPAHHERVMRLITMHEEMMGGMGR